MQFSNCNWLSVKLLLVIMSEKCMMTCTLQLLPEVTTITTLQVIVLNYRSNVARDLAFVLVRFLSKGGSRI